MTDVRLHVIPTQVSRSDKLIVCVHTDLLVLQPFVAGLTRVLLLQHDDGYSSCGDDEDDDDDEAENTADQSPELAQLVLKERHLLLQHLFADLELKHSQCVAVQLRREELVHVQRADHHTAHATRAAHLQLMNTA